MDAQQLNEQYTKMTQTPVEKLVLRLAGPTVASMLITSIYNMADTYFIGKINTSATAAVGVVFSLMALIQAVGFFFGHGSGNYISRALGRRQTDTAGAMAAVGFFLSLFTGAVLGLAGLLLLRPLMRVLGATPTILPYACDYAFYILLGTPFMTASLTINNQLRYQGSTLYAMIGITAGGVLNMALDPLFIFTLGMGTGGAALATVISQLVSFCLLLVFVQRKGIPIRARSFTLQARYLKELVRGGLPSLARQGCGGLGIMVLNHAAGLYGDAAIAALSIVNKITAFASSAMIGYGQGFQPVCGYNYGAKKYSRVKRAFWFCVRSSFLVLLGVAAAGFVFAPQIVVLFRRGDAQVAQIGAWALRLQCVSFPFTGFVVLCNMLAQTIGMAQKATLLAMSRQFLFLIPAVLGLSWLFDLPGLVCSQTAADILALVLAAPVGLGILHGFAPDGAGRQPAEKAAEEPPQTEK